MPRLSLCFEDMAERHAELAWRFGEPDDCRDGEHGRWTLVSPLPPEAGAEEHLSWAADCLGPHEAFVGELISLGGRVVVRLDCGRNGAEAVLKFNARRLLPMAHAGVLVEIGIG